MALLIKKFGGTSVGDITKIKAIAQSIGKSKETKIEDAFKDYLHLIDYVYQHADYIAAQLKMFRKGYEDPTGRTNGGEAKITMTVAIGEGHGNSMEVVH